MRHADDGVEDDIVCVVEAGEDGEVGDVRDVDEGAGGGPDVADGGALGIRRMLGVEVKQADDGVLQCGQDCERG